VTTISTKTTAEKNRYGESYRDRKQKTKTPLKFERKYSHLRRMHSTRTCAPRLRVSMYIWSSESAIWCSESRWVCDNNGRSAQVAVVGMGAQ
jgi:hypothetical protein